MLNGLNRWQRIALLVYLLAVLWRVESIVVPEGVCGADVVTAINPPDIPDEDFRMYSSRFGCQDRARGDVIDFGIVLVLLTAGMAAAVVLLRESD